MCESVLDVRAGLGWGRGRVGGGMVKGGWTGKWEYI